MERGVEGKQAKMAKTVMSHHDPIEIHSVCDTILDTGRPSAAHDGSKIHALWLACFGKA